MKTVARLTLVAASIGSWLWLLSVWWRLAVLPSWVALGNLQSVNPLILAALLAPLGLMITLSRVGSNDTGSSAEALASSVAGVILTLLCVGGTYLSSWLASILG